MVGGRRLHCVLQRPRHRQWVCSSWRGRVCVCRSESSFVYLSSIRTYFIWIIIIIRCQHPPSGGLQFANLPLVNGPQLRERSIHPPNAIVKPTLSAPGGGPQTTVQWQQPLPHRAEGDTLCCLKDLFATGFPFRIKELSIQWKPFNKYGFSSYWWIISSTILRYTSLTQLK